MRLSIVALLFHFVSLLRWDPVDPGLDNQILSSISGQATGSTWQQPQAPHQPNLPKAPVHLHLCRDSCYPFHDLGDKVALRKKQAQAEIFDRAARFCGLNQTSDEDSTLVLGMNPPIMLSESTY